jgi:6-phospho-beta-glucosidase
MAGLFILGGSTYYTLLLLQSLEKQGIAQNFSRIALFGRNADRLKLVAQAGSKLVNGKVPIVVTDKIEDCLDPEYSVLFNQIRFGGLQARDTDEKIAISVGLAADETIGIVGISNAIRTIIGIETLVETLRAKTGNYTFLNFTNPCSIVCQYLSEMLDARVIGICDYPASMQHEIARVKGVPPSSVVLDYFGLNHFGFVHGLTIDGCDALDDAIAAQPSFKPECNRYFSTLLNVSWSFIFEAERITTRQRSKPNRADSLLQIEGACEALLASGEEQPVAYLDILAQRDCHWYDLAVSPVLAQLTGARAQPVYINCAAGDALQLGLEQTVIEASCMLRSDAVSFTPYPERLRALPEYLLVRTMKQAELALLSGITSREPDAIIAACLINPMIRSLDATQRYFSKLCEVDADMRQFWKGAI